MSAILALLTRIPFLGWVAAAAIAWGGLNYWQADRHRAKAEAATQSAQQHAAAALAERQAREFEQQRAQVAQEKADAYAKDRQRSAAAAAGARSELDRLRDALTAAAGASAAASGASASGGADGAAAAWTMVRSGAEALQAMAAACDAEESKLTGLQEWVRGMGFAPPTSAP